MANAFVEERLPDEVEKNAVGGPQFKTIVTTLASGHEQRNIQWSQSRAKWDIGYGLSHLKEGKSQSYLNKVIEFFYARRGQAVGFRFKDWTDYSVNNQLIGVGDDLLQDFQIVKIYNSTGVSYTRILSKIVENSETVTINDIETSNYTIDYNTGIITLNSPLALGAILKVSCEFDVPVRFDTDELDITAVTSDAGFIGSIPIIEVRQDG